MRITSTATALAVAVTVALAPATSASSITTAPHVVDGALADTARVVSRAMPAVHGQPPHSEREIMATMCAAQPVLVDAANDFRARYGLGPLRQVPALDEYAQARADMLAAQTRAVAVPTRPVYETIAFVPDNPTEQVPRMRERSPLAAYVLTAHKTGAVAVGISYTYLPLRGWGYIVVTHTAPAGTDF